MADEYVSIDELRDAEVARDNDELILQQNGETKKIQLDTLGQLLRYIESIEQTVTATEPDGQNEMTVTLSDGTEKKFHVKNGTGIASLVQTVTSTQGGGLNVWTATLTNGETYLFEVRNGHNGKPFTIAKIYSSIAEMIAGHATDPVEVGEFVMIDTGSVEDPDTGKLYVKTELTYNLIADLSGAQGIKGETGNGIASIVQTETSTEPGGQNEITVTMTDGSVTKFYVMNGSGSSGGSALVPSMTQAEYDELPEEEKNNGQIREITDAEGIPVPFAILNDDIVTGANVLSASKVMAEVEKVDAKNNYSTEETVVGTWIDGKPIYRITINILNNFTGTNWGDTGINVNSLNIDKLIYKSVISNISNTRTAAYQISKIETDGKVYVGSLSNTSIAITTNDFIVLEYTKTTD